MRVLTWQIDSRQTCPTVARNSAGFFQTSSKLRYAVRLLANDTKLLAEANQLRLAPPTPPLFAFRQQVIALKRGLYSHGIVRSLDVRSRHAQLVVRPPSLHSADRPSTSTASSR